MGDRKRTEVGEFAPEVADGEILPVLGRGDAPVATATDIADEIGLTRQTVTRRLKRLSDAGFVDRKKVGARAVVWWLTDQGKLADLSHHHDETDAPPSSHEQAFETFAERAMDAVGEEIHEIILFGSTVRGEQRGVDSDVDVFVVVETMDVKDTLDEIAYQAMHEHGVVVSLIVKTTAVVENSADHPFLRNVRREGRVYG